MVRDAREPVGRGAARHGRREAEHHNPTAATANLPEGRGDSPTGRGLATAVRHLGAGWGTCAASSGVARTGDPATAPCLPDRPPPGPPTDTLLLRKQCTYRKVGEPGKMMVPVL